MNNVLSTKASIFRNLKDYKFVPKLKDEEKQEIKGKIEKLLEGKKAQIRLFDGEHLTIESSVDGYSSTAFEQVKEVADYLSHKICFAYSDEYGYLMSDIKKIGAGVRLECEMCLDSIKVLGKMDQLRQNLAKLGYVLIETKLPSVYKISTMCNLGMGENQIREDFEKTIQKLQDLEVESIKILDLNKHDELMDKMCRSIAILSSAYILTFDELNKLIIHVRNGINLGLTNIKVETINKLQKLTQDQNQEFISQSELKDLASKVKSILKGE